MFTEDKVTEIFCIADDFCKFYDAMMAKYTVKAPIKRPYHRDGTLSKAEVMLIMILFHGSGYRCLKLFSTWYPTDHRIPWLMTDHTYYMQTIHEPIGYNQPTNLGYYLGSDCLSDSEIWAAARQVEADRLRARGDEPTTAIVEVSGFMLVARWL